MFVPNTFMVSMIFPFAIIIGLQFLHVAATIEQDFSENNLQIHPKQIIVLPGKNYTVTCNSPDPISLCRIDITGRQRSYILTPGLSKNGISYFGRGLENGECGMRLTAVSEEDNGYIICSVVLVENQKERSNNVKLIVARSPSPPVLEPSSLPEMAPGENIQLNCIVANGRPAANISWFLDETPVTSGLGDVIHTHVLPDKETSEQILTYQLQPTDNGKTIHCVAEHPSLGTALVASIHLQVKSIPKAQISESVTPIYKQGDVCTIIGTNTTGICSPFSSCSSAKDAACRGILPQKCDLTNSNDLICCLPWPGCPALAHGTVNIQRTDSKASNYCIDLAEKLFPCEKKNDKWTRDDLCGPLRREKGNNSFLPFIAHLGTGNPDDITWSSEGALISDQWIILTAFTLQTIPELIYVGLGGLLKPDIQVYTIAQKVTHPGYEFPNWYDNIGLIKTNEKIVFSPRVIPVCLHTSSILPKAGLSQMAVDGLKTLTQFQWSVDINSNDDCQSYFEDEHLPEGIRENVMFCITPKKNVGNCYGGVGVVVDNDVNVACTQVLVGYTFVRKTDCSHFLVATINPYVSWIESEVWP